MLLMSYIVDESGASDDEHFYSMTSDSDADQAAPQPVIVQVKDVYKPPTELHRVNMRLSASERVSAWILVQSDTSISYFCHDKLLCQIVTEIQVSF